MIWLRISFSLLLVQTHPYTLTHTKSTLKGSWGSRQRVISSVLKMCSWESWQACVRMWCPKTVWSYFFFFNHMSSRTRLLVWQLLPRSLCVTTGDVLIPVISKITLILIKLIPEPKTSYSAQHGKHGISYHPYFLPVFFFFTSILSFPGFFPHDPILARTPALLGM